MRKVPHPQPSVSRRAFGLASARALTFCLATALHGANPPGFDIVEPTPGGLSPQPVISSITAATQGMVLKWGGLKGPYQIERNRALTSGNWTPDGSPVTNTTATVAQHGDASLFRVKDTSSPMYVGAAICRLCHRSVHNQWTNTAHFGALKTLKAINQHNNPACLACHTVGYGQPTGFVSETATPGLGGVQCENCHGPGEEHASNYEDPTLRPVITVSAMMCGGCHNGFHHPTYDEWKQAGHAHVSEPGMFNSGAGRMYQCGVCHSGAVRKEVVNDYDKGGNGTNVKPPSIEDANNTGQTCATCHDPHQRFTEKLPGTDLLAKPAQLRNPIGSTKFMSFFTSTSPTNFAAQYDPNIQICGQCHNERGATWTGTGRPPHHSPQYNILIGQAVDPRFDTNTLNGTLVPFNKSAAAHGDSTVAAPWGNPAQCTTCHNRAEEVEGLSPVNPNYTGHKFEVQLLACADCHGFLDDPNAEEIAQGGVEFIQAGVHQGIQEVLAALNIWATNKIPGLDTPGSTNYIAFIGTNNPSRVVPWETTTAGQLNTGKVGPGTAGQNRTPNPIKQSRFLLYLVEHDASYGVHNPPYARHLLKTAKDLANAAPAVPAN